MTLNLWLSSGVWLEVGSQTTESPNAVRASSSDVVCDKEVEDVSNLEDTQSAYREPWLYDLVKRESEALIPSLSPLWGKQTRFGFATLTPVISDRMLISKMSASLWVP